MVRTLPAPGERVRGWVSRAVTPTILYVLTSVVVFVGAWLPTGHSDRQPLDVDTTMFAGRLMGLNGYEYARVARDGYTYDPARLSNIAFFPAYPMAGRWLAAVTHLPVEVSLLIVTHISLLGAFLVMHSYVRQRFPSSGAQFSRFVLLGFGLWPTTVFFRVGHCEALFLLTVIVAMYAMECGWHPLVVAIIAGLATATRHLGVALLAPFVLYLADNAHAAASIETTACPRRVAARFARRAIWALPLACWGIAGFMAFQAVAFDDALAFAKTHQFWAQRPSTPYLEQLGRAFILEPIWSVYDPSSAVYWARLDQVQNPILSLPFANPIYLLIAAALSVLGWRKGWLNSREVLLAAGLLAIPYFTHGYRHAMLSQGRCAAVAFPVYIVMGRLMARAPTWLVAVGCALSAVLLAAYAALFAAWYRVT